MPQDPLRCFFVVSNYILAHPSDLNFVIAPAPTLTASAVTASVRIFPQYPKLWTTHTISVDSQLQIGAESYFCICTFINYQKLFHLCSVFCKRFWQKIDFEKLSEKLNSRLLVQEEHGFKRGHIVPPWPQEIQKAWPGQSK